MCAKAMQQVSVKYLSNISNCKAMCESNGGRIVRANGKLKDVDSFSPSAESTGDDAAAQHHSPHSSLCQK